MHTTFHECRGQYERVSLLHGMAIFGLSPSVVRMMDCPVRRVRARMFTGEFVSDWAACVCPSTLNVNVRCT